MPNRILFHSRALSWLIGALLFAPIMKTSLISLAQAQSQCETALEEAEEAYYSSRLEDVIRLLNPCLPSGFPEENQRLRAYKLLALAHISANQTNQAQNALAALVDLNPNYEPDPLQESTNFIGLVTEAKQSRLGRITNPPRSKKWFWLGGSLVVAGTVTALLFRGAEEPSPSGRSRLPDPPVLPSLP